MTLDLEESGGSGSTDFTEAATATAASHSSAEDQPAADSALDPDSGVAVSDLDFNVLRGCT